MARRAVALKVVTSLTAASSCAGFRVPVPDRVEGLRILDEGVMLFRCHGNPAGPRLLVSHGNGFAADMYFPLRGRFFGNSVLRGRSSVRIEIWSPPERAESPRAHSLQWTSSLAPARAFVVSPSEANQADQRIP